MKWTYKDCEVEVTATYDSADMVCLTPIVEIACRETDGPKCCLTTGKAFETAIEAELFGATMAREWIDERSQGREIGVVTGRVDAAEGPAIASMSTCEQLERQIDDLCAEYLKGRDREVQKQIMELQKRLEDLEKNESAG